jgi:hypothetical protein
VGTKGAAGGVVDACVHHAVWPGIQVVLKSLKHLFASQSLDFVVWLLRR